MDPKIRERVLEGLKPEVEALKKWASSNPLIQKVYIYGSHALGNENGCSDLDVAIEIKARKGDNTIETTWICEARRWREEISFSLRYNLDLNWYDPIETPPVHKGIVAGNYLVFSRKGSQSL